MTDEQILPMGPVQKAIRAQNRRLTLLQEQVDALCSLENSTAERLERVYDAFLRHTHDDGPTGENAVNANAERLEAVRHDG